MVLVMDVLLGENQNSEISSCLLSLAPGLEMENLIISIVIIIIIFIIYISFSQNRTDR